MSHRYMQFSEEAGYTQYFQKHSMAKHLELEVDVEV